MLVSQECAPLLGACIERATGHDVRYYGEVLYALTTPVLPFWHEAVRRLTPDDAALLEASPETWQELHGSGWATTQQMLQEGAAAGAVVEGQLAAIAYTCARTPRHAEVAVYTLRSWRRRGPASATASLVCRQIQEEGQTPVWSTGDDHLASQRVARKLGFAEVARRTYVIPQREPAVDEGNELHEGHHKGHRESGETR